MIHYSVFDQGEASLLRHGKKECFGLAKKSQGNEILLFHEKEQTYCTQQFGWISKCYILYNSIYTIIFATYMSLKLS